MSSWKAAALMPGRRLFGSHLPHDTWFFRTTEEPHFPGQTPGKAGTGVTAGAGNGHSEPMVMAGGLQPAFNSKARTCRSLAICSLQPAGLPSVKGFSRSWHGGPSWDRGLCQVVGQQEGGYLGMAVLLSTTAPTLSSQPGRGSRGLLGVFALPQSST